MVLLILVISAVCLGYGYAVLTILAVAVGVWLVWSVCHLALALLYGLAAGVVWGCLGLGFLVDRLPALPGLTAPCRLEAWWCRQDETLRGVLGWTLGLGAFVGLMVAAHLLLPR
jgi:hypothetical protein